MIARITLRPYQDRAIVKIRAVYRRGGRRVLFVLPTGGGKTIVFAFIVSSAVERGRRVLILAHRQEIVDQISEALTGMSVRHGIIAAGYPPTDATVQIASVATLARRLGNMPPFDLIVIDEAHHTISSTCTKIIEHYPHARVLGVTATSERLDGCGLDIFEAMIEGPQTAELQRLGFLAKAVVFAPADTPDLSGVRSRGGDWVPEQLSEVMSRGQLIAGVVDEYERRAWGKPAIVFCCTVDDSRLVARRFGERGHRAAHVDGNSPKAERRQLIAALGSGDLEVLCNASLISEGVDVPAVEVAILLRPTKSLALYLQQVGRVLRPAPGKDHATIFDFAGNTFRHGLPDTPRQWSLTGRSRQTAPSLASFPRLRHCLGCCAINAPRFVNCIGCGGNLKRSAVVEIDMALREISPAVLRQQVDLLGYYDALRWAGDSPDRLRIVAAVKGFKSGWVWHRLRELAA